MLRALMFAVALAATAAPAAALDGPLDLIGSLYRLPGGLDSAELADAYLARDAAAAYKGQLGADEPKPATGFDWRHNAQDGAITDLTVTGPIASEERGGIPFVKVVASFRRDGVEDAVSYTLCLGPAGWRVSDAANLGADPWALRSLLDLPAEASRC